MQRGQISAVLSLVSGVPMSAATRGGWYLKSFGLFRRMAWVRHETWSFIISSCFAQVRDVASWPQQLTYSFSSPSYCVTPWVDRNSCVYNYIARRQSSPTAKTAAIESLDRLKCVAQNMGAKIYQNKNDTPIYQSWDQSGPGRWQRDTKQSTKIWKHKRRRSKTPTWKHIFLFVLECCDLLKNQRAQRLGVYRCFSFF